MAFVEIMKWLIPSIAVVLIAYWIINRPIKLARIKQEAETERANLSLLTPTRMNAYERLTLLMQRIIPESLLMRHNTQGYNIMQLQSALLGTIREEFDHNTTQQLYVSDEAWEAVTEAKNAIVNLINITATALPPNADAIVLAEKILTTYAKLDDTPIEEAINKLKSELIGINES